MCDGVIVAELSVIRVLLSFLFVCAADSAENVTYVGRLGI